MSAPATRRGFLGLFAAAPLAAQAIADAAEAASQPAPFARATDGTPISREQVLAGIRRRIAENEHFLALRPAVRPESPVILNLQRPACEHGCTPCLMNCAILTERTEWWKVELARLEAGGEIR